MADGAGTRPNGHGFTYSAQFVGAAFALEVLAFYEDGLLENGRRMGARLLAGLEMLCNHPLVGDVHGRGMLAAVELLIDEAAKTQLTAAATRLFERTSDEGLVIRAFAQGMLGYGPPHCCTGDEIEAIVARSRQMLNLTLDDPDVRAALH